MKITIETSDSSSRILGIFSFILGSILILISLFAATITNFIFPILLIIVSAILLFLGILLVIKSM